MTNAPQAGDTAPGFEMATDRAPVKLEALKGRTIVLYFYPKDDTSGCTSEAKAFSDLQAEFVAVGAVVIGVSKDSTASHARFRAKHALNVELGADPDGAAVEAYGAWVEKSMYGRKYMGIERCTYLIGPQGVIERVWRKVKVPGHAAEVLVAAKTISS